MQRLHGDAQNLRGSRFVVAGVSERQFDQLPLGFADRHAGAQARRRGARRPGHGEVGREMFGLDEISAAQDDGSLDHVSKLANVSRPPIFLQQRCGFGIKRPDRPAVAGIELLDEGLREQRNIVRALAQRRHLDRDDVEPVVQVFS